MTVKTTNRVAKAALKAHKKDLVSRLNAAIRKTWEIDPRLGRARQVDDALMSLQQECKKLYDYAQSLRDELDDRLPAQQKDVS